MNFFFDHNLSPRIARALSELFKDEHIIVALRDKFKSDVTDVEWMRGLSAEGRWVIISGDRKIRKNSAEFHTFRNSPLVGFFMAKSLYKATVVRQTERILNQWPDIVALAGAVGGGAMYEMTLGRGRIKQLSV